MRNIVGVILVIVSFLSCTNPNKKIPTLVAFKQGPLDSAYSAIRPTIQNFNIDNNKVNTVKAKAGTEIFIPANCFVDGGGAAITGNIQLEIIEAFSLQDFITSGLATMSDNKMLISNGMMYLNAKSGDTKLQLVNGAALSLSMPTMKQNGGFQMFTGDGTNWKVNSTMTETDYSIPLSLNLLYPTGNKLNIIQDKICISIRSLT